MSEGFVKFEAGAVALDHDSPCVVEGGEVVGVDAEGAFVLLDGFRGEALKGERVAEAFSGEGAVGRGDKSSEDLLGFAAAVLGEEVLSEVEECGGVVALEFEGGEEGAFGTDMVADGVENDAEVGEGGGVVGGEFGGLSGVVHREWEFAESEVDEAEVHVTIGVVGFESQCGEVGVAGFEEALEELVGESESVEAAGGVGVEPDDGFVLIEGGFVVAFGAEQVAEEDAGFDEFGGEVGGGGEAGLGDGGVAAFVGEDAFGVGLGGLS